MRYIKYLPILALLILPSFSPGGDSSSHIGREFLIDINGIGSNSLGISMAVHPRFIQRDDYFILTYVIVMDERGNVVAETLSDPHPIVARSRERNERGLIDIARQIIPLDLGGYIGPAGVGVICQIFDKKERPVRNATAEAFEVVDIRGGECDPAAIPALTDGEELPPVDIDPASIQWEPRGHFFGPGGIAVINRSSHQEKE